MSETKQRIGESGRPVIEHERYFTPGWVTDCALKHVALREPILDAGAGENHITNQLRLRGYRDIYGVDIVPDEARNILEMNFLKDELLPELPPIHTVFMNPPFGAQGRMAHKFIKRALEIVRPQAGMVVALLRPQFDAAPSRRDIFKDCAAFNMRIVLNERIIWANLPQVDAKGEPAKPSKDHAWFVWDWSNARLPIVRYSP